MTLSLESVFFDDLIYDILTFKRVINMVVKKPPMSMGQKIFYIISFIVLIWGFVFLGTRNYKVKELTDPELFNKEFKTVSDDNHFQVLSSSEALTFLERGTGILFLGFPDNKWSVSVAEMLDQVSKELDYSPIYYFNFYDERESRHDNYLGIMREIDDYLDSDDKGNLDIYAPTVIGVIHGDVVYFDDETTFMNNRMDPKDYWNEEQKNKKMARFRFVLNDLQKEMSE